MSARPSAATAALALPLVRKLAPAAVPAIMPIIIGHSRRSKGRNCPPTSICQTLVTMEGAISKAAASAGDMKSTSSPTATVGKPRPITPLTNPARKKIGAASNTVGSTSCTVTSLFGYRRCSVGMVIAATPVATKASPTHISSQLSARIACLFAVASGYTMSAAAYQLGGQACFG